MNLIEKLTKSVVDGDSEQAVLLAKEVLKHELDINEVILNGLNEGMRIVGKLYEKKEYFLPEIIISADALYDALAILKPHLEVQYLEKKATVVIGVVRGDIHDIGKNLTKIFLETSGYKVIDCGRNVKADTFIKAIKENQADVLALSTLMNPTLESIVELVNLLKELGLHKKLKIIIGGAATNEIFAETIDVIYCKDAPSAIKLLDKYFSGGDI
ncbi:MAG: B12-binding domain-containing protein [Candidatus Hodarchaeota archaeon]